MIDDVLRSAAEYRALFSANHYIAARHLMTPRQPDLSVQEAADLLGVHYMTAYRYIRTGRLPAQRRDDGWAVRRADAEALRDGRLPHAIAAPGRGRSSWSQQSQRLRDRMVDGDERGAWNIVEAALSGGTAPADLHLEVLAPALRRIGEEWSRGIVTVADEHRATAIATRIVGRLGPRFARRGRPRGTVLLGVAPDDHHSLPAAIVCDVLRGSGYRVIELGGATPLDSFLSAADEAGPLVAIGVSASTATQLDAAGDVLEAVRRRQPDTPLLLGGPAILDADTALALGADGWAPDARATAALIESVRDRSRP
jgi:excisionase family DNA binding protein